MSLGSEIYTKLKNDAGIIAIVGSHVYGTIIPDSLDVTQDVLVFAYDQENGYHALDGYNALEIYSLVVALFSQNTDTLESLSNAVRTCLDEYTSETLLDIQFNGHTNEPDSERDRFIRIMDYRITYNNN